MGERVADGPEVVQEVLVESPQLFHLDAAHSQLVEDAREDAGVCETSE